MYVVIAGILGFFFVRPAALGPAARRGRVGAALPGRADHGVAGGDLALPRGVRIVAAANPPGIAADGWELSAPLVNRLVHLDWRIAAARPPGAPSALLEEMKTVLKISHRIREKIL